MYRYPASGATRAAHAQTGTCTVAMWSIEEYLSPINPPPSGSPSRRLRLALLRAGSHIRGERYSSRRNAAPPRLLCGARSCVQDLGPTLAYRAPRCGTAGAAPAAAAWTTVAPPPVGESYGKQCCGAFVRRRASPSIDPAIATWRDVCANPLVSSAAHE